MLILKHSALQRPPQSLDQNQASVYNKEREREREREREKEIGMREREKGKKSRKGHVKRKL